jgi:hypothetical protein
MMVGTSSRDGHRLVSKGRPKSEENSRPPRMTELRSLGGETSFMGQNIRDM